MILYHSNVSGKVIIMGMKMNEYKSVSVVIVTVSLTVHFAFSSNVLFLVLFHA